MHKWILGTVAVVAVLAVSEASAFAQMGMPAMPGMGGMGGAATRRPQRKLKRNQAPVLSPALNMVPGVATSFEGQFLMRTLPQEQVYKNTSQFNRQIEGLQNKTLQQDAQIKSGIGKTGHSSRFMNYGSYYSSGAGGRRNQ
jgi:hypothetical protein